MKNNIYQSLQQAFTVGTYVDRGLTLTRGDGVYLLDTEDDQYLDMMSNYGVNVFGYNHPTINEALSEQIKKLTTLHSSFNNDARSLAAKALVKRCGGGLNKVFFSNSGSEAIEAALKFAILATGKKNFVVAAHGYHGKTLGALSATQGLKYKQDFSPLLWNFQAAEFGNIKALEKLITTNTAAIILEPIQGEGGIHLPPTDYLTKVRALCNKQGVLLIIDEIQTGCGRTGTFLASEKDNIGYDIVCLGKGLAGGIPIGATLISREVSKHIPKHIHTSTFGGNPLACAGVSITLKLLDKSLLNQVQNLGEYFLKSLSSLKEGNSQIVATRGLGLMIGVEVTGNRDQILKKLQKNHILAIPAGQSVIRFLPPLLIKRHHVDLVIQTLQKVLDER